MRQNNDNTEQDHLIFATPTTASGRLDGREERARLRSSDAKESAAASDKELTTAVDPHAHDCGNGIVVKVLTRIYVDRGHRSVLRVVTMSSRYYSMDVRS